MPADAVDMEAEGDGRHPRALDAIEEAREMTRQVFMMYGIDVFPHKCFPPAGLTRDEAWQWIREWRREYYDTTPEVTGHVTTPTPVSASSTGANDDVLDESDLESMIE